MKMKDKVWERVKYWAQIFLVPLYLLSYLSRRDKNIWLFGSTFGRRFSENPRYLFLYAAQHPECGIRPIWISHNKKVVRFLQHKGYEAYTYHSFRGIYYALRAGVYIYDNYSKDINFWQSGGALKINLWHGSGNKKANHDNMHDKVRHPQNLWERWTTWLRRLSDEKPYHYTLASSDAIAVIHASAFNTDISHIIIENNPRNDSFFSSSISGIKNVYSKQEKQLRKVIKESREAGKKIITYMPTFRESETKFFEVMDLAVFDAFLEEHGYVLVAKLHPKSRIKEVFENVKGKSILNVDPEVDAYSILGLSDMLITDYSSVYTDFMMTKRPVIAFDFDWEEYSQNTRECYIDQDEYMPERKAIDMEELMLAIPEVFAHDSHFEYRMRSMKRMLKYTDGKTCQRMMGRIKQLAHVE